MFLESYFSRQDGRVCISAPQASRFAREIAGDYNPIHDPDARRFCVPGDLLFALVLHFYGLSQQMKFRFVGMVGDSVPLVFPEQPGKVFTVTDERGREYLQVERAGEVVAEPACVEAFIRSYVGFSGQNFPHVLNPLMAREGVMFNPERPLVIYDSMSFELYAPECVDEAALRLVDSRLAVKGKRADAMLDFVVEVGKDVVGEGAKKLVLASLQDYDEARLRAFTRQFEARQQPSA